MKVGHLSVIVLAFGLYNAAIYYAGWNIWIWLQTIFSFQSPAWFVCFMIFISYSFIIARVPNRFPLLRIIGSCWFAFVQYGLILFPIANLSYFLLRTFSIEHESLIFFIGLSVLLLFLGLFLYGAFHAYSPVIHRHSVSISKAANGLGTLRIAFASDMHFGTLSGVSHAERLVKELNHLDADIVFFGGDLIDDHPEPFLAKGMGDIMSQIQSTYGMYAVLGNHDYYGGKVPELLDEMNRIGVHMLLDEHILVDEHFVILGRKDFSDKKRDSIHRLMEKVDSNLPVLVLDHQPQELSAVSNAKADMILCGHTHRGQMAPNHLVTKRVFELDYGYKQFGHMHAFVSSGFGFWGPPIRIGSRSEILFIEVTFDKI